MNIQSASGPALGANVAAWLADPTIAKLVTALGGISAGLVPTGGMSGVASSVTGTTTETILATIAIPSGLIGANGQALVLSTWSLTNSANNKTLNGRIGASGAGTGGSLFQNIGLTTTGGYAELRRLANRNAQNSQIWSHRLTFAGGLGGGGNAPTTTAIDTSAASEIVLTGTLANTGETITLESFLVLIFSKA